MNAEPELPNPNPGKSLRFHQIKSNFFRVVYADGVWGSVHPTDFVHLTFYNERAPIAQEVVLPLKEDGTLGEEDFSKRKSRSGYVREMEVDVILRRDVAASLHTWLGKYLEGNLKGLPISYE